MGPFFEYFASFKKFVQQKFKAASWNSAVPFSKIFKRVIIEGAASLTRCSSLHFIYIWPESHRDHQNEVGSLNPVELQVGFEPRTFQFIPNALKTSCDSDKLTHNQSLFQTWFRLMKWKGSQWTGVEFRAMLQAGNNNSWSNSSPRHHHVRTMNIKESFEIYYLLGSS